MIGTTQVGIFPLGVIKALPETLLDGGGTCFVHAKMDDTATHTTTHNNDDSSRLKISLIDIIAIVFNVTVKKQFKLLKTPFYLT